MRSADHFNALLLAPSDFSSPPFFPFPSPPLSSPLLRPSPLSHNQLLTQVCRNEHFVPVQIIAGVLVDRPPDRMSALGREQLEQLILNTMELVTQTLLLVFTPALAAEVEIFEQRANDMISSPELPMNLRPVMSPALLQAKKLCAQQQTLTLRWIHQRLETGFPKPPAGFVAYIFNKLLFIQDAEAYFGAKVSS